MGSLLWTEREALDTTIYSILLASDGFYEWQRAIHGAPEPDGKLALPKKKQTPQEVAAIMRSFKKQRVDR